MSVSTQEKSGVEKEEVAAFTKAYQEAAKRGTAQVVENEKTGFNVDHRAKVIDPSLPLRIRIANRIANTLQERIHSKPTLLDIGCSTGGDLKRICDKVGEENAKYVRVLGIDLLEAQLPDARKAVPNGEFVAGDVAKLPYSDGEVDVLHASRLLIHCPNIGEALAEMVRVLKPGGLGILVEANMSNHSHLVSSSDKRLLSVHTVLHDHVASCCAQPSAAVDAFRLLHSMSQVTEVEALNFSPVVKAPPPGEPDLELTWYGSILPKLVEAGRLPQDDVDYYVKNLPLAKQNGDWLGIYHMFEISFIKTKGA